MNRTTIIHADVMEGLRSMADESVHMVMTSPPYW
jgi:DNA modification methylase